MMKPRVQTLLLFTTITTMYVAGNPSIGRVALTCLGGAMSAGGAGAMNHWFDRDLDAIMTRTANRPVRAGRVAPTHALIFGIVLGVAAFVLLATTVNVLAATLSLCGLLGYVFVYTIWLKRRTPQNIVIGGAAGAVPPLVAWAATTGRLTGSALYLFAIVFYWTPPPFWALSLLMKDEYAKAKVPMMPVRPPVPGGGESATRGSRAPPQIGRYLRKRRPMAGDESLEPSPSCAEPLFPDGVKTTPFAHHAFVRPALGRTSPKTSQGGRHNAAQAASYRTARIARWCSHGRGARLARVGRRLQGQLV